MGRWQVRSWAASGAVGLSLALAMGTAITGAASPAQAAAIPAAAAQSKVTKKVPGRVLEVKKTRRDGFISWAVTIQRRDGSIVVGYVDQRSGIVFDWTVQRGPGGPVVDIDGPDGTLAPAKPPVTSPVSGGGPANDDTATEEPTESEPNSTEEPGSGDGGPAPSGPSGANPSIVHVEENPSWNYSIWDDPSWMGFWNWVVSSWTMVEPEGDSSSSGGFPTYVWTGGSFTWDGTSVHLGDSSWSDDSSAGTDDFDAPGSDTPGSDAPGSDAPDSDGHADASDTDAGHSDDAGGSGAGDGSAGGSADAGGSAAGASGGSDGD